MALYLPIRAYNRSQNVRIARTKISPTATTYIDISDVATRKEFTYHSAIGAVYAVGAVTASDSDQVVWTGGVVSNGSGLTVNVTAGEIRTRSTGVFVTGVAGTNFALTVADGTQDRTDLIWWDGTSGAVGKTNGTLAAAGLSVAPATPAGKVPLATVLVAATVTSPGTKTDVRPRP